MGAYQRPSEWCAGARKLGAEQGLHDIRAAKQSTRWSHRPDLLAEPWGLGGVSQHLAGAAEVGSTEMHAYGAAL